MALHFDFDPDEITNPDIGSGLGDLADPDPLVMLGKVAASVARTEKAVRELAAVVKVHQEKLRSMHTRARNLTVSAVVVFEVLIQVLQRTGVLK